MSEDYDLDYEAACPICGHSPIRSRDCDSLLCEDGYVDSYEDDPINFMQGEEFLPCSECKGTGIVVWCPACGADLTGHKFEDEEEDFEDPNQLKLPL